MIVRTVGVIVAVIVATNVVVVAALWARFRVEERRRR